MKGTRPRLVAFAGSLRKGSWNEKLIQVAANAARNSGAEVKVLDLGHYALPLFSQDIEDLDGGPPAARELRKDFGAADGFLIASPEYNGFFTPLIKNVLDWASRFEDTPEDPDIFHGKPAAIISASPGAMGGLRALPHLRLLLSNLGLLVLPDQVAVGKAHTLLPDDSNQPLKDAFLQKRIEDLSRSLVDLASRR